MKWQSISAYEGMYKISNTGIVASLDRYIPHPKSGESLIKGRILTIQTDANGYKYIHLNKSGKSKAFKIHVLVARAFIKNPKGHPFVNHKDGNKANNNVTNLEWCTQSENEKHAHSIGLKNHKGENHPISQFSNEQILEVRRMFEKDKLSQREIGRKMNMNYKTVHKIVHRQRWAHI